MPEAVEKKVWRTDSKCKLHNEVAALENGDEYAFELTMPETRQFVVCPERRRMDGPNDFTCIRTDCPHHVDHIDPEEE